MSPAERIMYAASTIDLNRWVARFSLLWLPVALFLAGCYRSPDLTSLQQARDFFGQGEFDRAIQCVDQGISTTNNELENAQLLVIKGRCFWEQACATPSNDSKRELLDQSLKALSNSISVLDNAEARHIRAMVHEAMGRRNLATADKSVARTLDKSYRSAYVNEKRQEVLLDLRNLDDPENGDESNDEMRSSKAPDPGLAPQKRHEYLVDNDGDNEEPAERQGSVTREGDTPWPSTSSSRAASSARANRSGDGRVPPLTNPTPGNERDRATGSPAEGRGYPPGLVTRGTLPNVAEDEGDEEKRDEAAGVDRDENDEPAGRAAASRTPRPPTSTWQPIAPPAMPHERFLMPTAPTTGLVGPGFRQPLAQPGAAIPAPPTTGITGGTPPAYSMPALPVGPGVPTTGIGAAPVASSLPSGLPSQYMPQLNSPGLAIPFNGALPHQFRPAGAAVFGPNLSTTGPNYSPLRPSPLTAPQFNSFGRQLAPNTSTSPLIGPALPRRVTKPPAANATPSSDSAPKRTDGRTSAIRSSGR